MSEKATSKSIKLRTLKPGEWRTWSVQAEATFKLYKCLGIVHGTDFKPIVPADDGKNAAKRAKRRRSLKTWEERHDLALEALLKALEPVDLDKILSIKDDAAAIWARLKDEYAKSLDFEYIRVNAEFQSLRKESITPMNEHINKFNSLLQAVNYNRPPEVPELGLASINLSFLQSLGRHCTTHGRGACSRHEGSTFFISRPKQCDRRDGHESQYCKVWKWESWQQRWLWGQVEEESWQQERSTLQQ